MDINDLPPELFVKIFGYIDQLELLVTVSDVCRNWSRMTKSVSLWQQIDLNCLVIGQDESDLMKRIAEISSNIQYLKVSPTRLVQLCKHMGDNYTFTNLRNLEITPSQDVPNQVFDNFCKKCPRLKSLLISLLSEQIFALKSVFGNIDIDEVSIRHRFSVKDKELTHGEKHRLSVMLNENGEKIRKTNKLRIYSFSFEFLSSIVDVSPENVVCLGAFGRHFVHENDLCRLTDKTNVLAELQLDYSKVSDNDLCTVAENNPNLKQLSLQCCGLITDKGVSTVTKVCKSLERLLLRNSMNDGVFYGQISRQSRISLLAVSDQCSSLVHFSAQNLLSFDDTKLSTITRSCRLLTSLSFNSCRLLSDSALDVISQNCPKLKTGDFSQCPAISLNGVWNLISGCLEMSSLSLVACEGLTQFLSEERNAKSKTESKTENQTPSLQFEDSNNCAQRGHTSKIQTLNFSYCDNLDPSSLNRISEKCKNLQILILRFCAKINVIHSDIIRNLHTNCYLLNKILAGFNYVIERKNIETFLAEKRVYPICEVGKGGCI